MKILFLTPPVKDKLTPPLGIAYITSFLNKNGHEATINDGNNKTFKELIESVRKINPNIVGISMDTTSRFDCLDLAKEIKLRYKIPIILGGTHPTLMSDQLLKNYGFIDYIIRNEGEYTCLNLLNALEKRKSLKKIKGISYREGDKIIHNERAEPVMDLDSLPFPEYKFFDLKGYSKQPEHPKELLKYPVGSVMSSRGCPYRCSFCSSSNFWGHNIRFRSPKNVVDEIEYLYSKYDTRYIVFNDDSFTADKKRVVNICKLMIKRGLHKKVNWLCRSEVNIIDKELLMWMKKAGCHFVEYGVEDVSPEGLKFFRKAHNIKQLFNAFKLTHEAGLGIRSYIIDGGDHETIENIVLKKKIMEKLNPTITTASLLIAYPGTEIYEKGKQKGWWDDSIWLQKCTGKKFHNRVPIYPSKNMTLSQLFAASAEINYWWNKKKNNFDLKNTLEIVNGLIKRRDFLKLYTMGKSVIFRSLRDFL